MGLDGIGAGQNGRGGAPGTRSVRPRRSLADADELTHFAHELANLIDGSLRWISLASADLPVWAEAPEAIDRARSQIERVRGNLERMSGLVSAALRSGAVPIGSPLLAAGENVTLAEAIDHAIDVVRAEQAGSDVRITLELCADAGQAAAGPLYAPILNGLRNAVESIDSVAHACSDAVREVVVKATKLERDGGVWVRIDIVDSGPGVRSELRDGAAFEYGRTSKGKGRGVGLALAERIMSELGGLVRLEHRDGPASCGCGERTGAGALFTIEVPMPTEPGAIG